MCLKAQSPTEEDDHDASRWRDTAYLNIRVEFDQLANEVNSWDIGDTHESSCCLTERFHQRRTVTCIALLVDLDPFLDIACSSGHVSLNCDSEAQLLLHENVLSSLPSICEPPWQTGPSRSFSRAIAIDEVPVRE